uniref:Uncharacterized protein n=1 Tax=Meiothermus ruber TaxID=277 RepID=A0A7C3I113_MEIRU
MPSARALAAQRAGSKSANLEAAFKFIHDHPGQPVLLNSPGNSATVRYDDLEATPDGGAEPSYSVYLYSLKEWLPLSYRTLRSYLEMYGPYTWEVTDVRSEG